MKCPKIYVVCDFGSRDCQRYELYAWFFDEDEASDWAAYNRRDNQYFSIIEVEAGETLLNT